MSFLCVLHKNSYHLKIIFFNHLLPFFVQINNNVIIIFVEMTFSCIKYGFQKGSHKITKKYKIHTIRKDI